MRKTIPIRPAYAEKFRCIGSACEDNCCQNWIIPVDQPAYQKYQNLPPGPLRTHIDKSILLTPQTEAAPGVGSHPHSAPANFAQIQLDEFHQCSLLSQHGLCRIHAECGAGYLSHACATYPRIVHRIGPVEEQALTLSCPEAARLVLLNADLLDAFHAEPEEQPEEHAGDAESQGPDLLRRWFWPIRKSVLTLVLDRTYSLWQRLFMLGVFCRRLDSIARGELQRDVSDFLRDFEATVASGALRTAMETLPIARPRQLDVVLRLAGLLLHRSHLGPRFIHSIKAFTSGIGNGPEANLGTLTAHYETAHDDYYVPFFSRHPHMLENYLVNTIVRCQFPFKKEAMKPDVASSTVPPSMEREYALLIAQFALVKGLLIGVAGHYREGFAPAHVVHTVQAASRHFEHHPEFLNLARGLLAESQMDGARGLAILLRNAASQVPRHLARADGTPTVRPSPQSPIHVPRPRVT